jgi:choline dehydrogenase
VSTSAPATMGSALVSGSRITAATARRSERNARTRDSTDLVLRRVRALSWHPAVHSSFCPPGTWDLHLLVAVFPGADGVVLAMSSMLLQADWEGTVRLRSLDPASLPAVSELNLESDADMSAALEGVELARRLVGTEALADRVADELAPGADATPEELRARGREALTTYFHPVGTCAMGRVTDSTGNVRGFENLHVMDASIIPGPLRASPHLTVLALAERAAGLL